MSATETAILEGFITANKSDASERTRAKVRHFVYKLVATLHDIRPGVTLDTASYDDLAAIVPALKNKSGEPITKNSRQSFVTTLKALVEYMTKGREMKIAGNNYAFSKVKGGAPSRANKEIITPEDYEKVIACRMNTKERGIVALMWDGCLRPGEPFALCWSDFKITGDGLEYQITFKTEKTRRILMSSGGKAVLEQWRMACGANYGDKFPVFPDRSGRKYDTIEPVVKLFRRLREETGFEYMTPGCIRNSAITRDVMLGYQISYICQRCWGEPYNEMINVYVNMAKTIEAQRKEQERVTGRKIQAESVQAAKVANMKPCPKCGTENPADGVFCTSCGRSMSGDDNSTISNMEKKISEMQKMMDSMFKVLQATADVADPTGKHKPDREKVQREFGIL